MTFDEEMNAALIADAAKIEALGGDPGPTFEDGSRWQICCPACSEAGGADMPVFHAPPSCNGVDTPEGQHPASGERADTEKP